MKIAAPLSTIKANAIKKKKKLFIQKMQDPLLMYVSMFISTQQLNNRTPSKLLQNTTEKTQLNFSLS